MPKHIPDEIKLKAMELFLKGDKTAKQIAKEISTAEHKVAPPTIYMWAKKERWGEQKAVAIADRQTELAETEGERFARLQAAQLDGYTEIANKATREMTSLHFDRALDAARAATEAIWGFNPVVVTILPTKVAEVVTVSQMIVLKTLTEAPALSADLILIPVVALRAALRVMPTLAVSPVTLEIANLL